MAVDDDVTDEMLVLSKKRQMEADLEKELDMPVVSKKRQMEADLEKELDMYII